MDAQPQMPPTGPGTAIPDETPEARDVRENKDVAAFSYLWVMSVIVYFLRRDSAFVRYHSKQAMLLFALTIPLWFIPYIGRLLDLVLFAGMVMGFLAAAQGERKDVPIVGRLSRGEITVRQAWKEIVDVVGTAVRALSELRKSSSKPSAHPAPASATSSAPAEPAPASMPTPPSPETPPVPPLS